MGKTCANVNVNVNVDVDVDVDANVNVNGGLVLHILPHLTELMSSYLPLGPWGWTSVNITSRLYTYYTYGANGLVATS